MSGTDRKLNAAQRQELIRLHVEVSGKAARDQAEAWGVARNYPAVHASTCGVHRKNWKPKDADDPRWQWAIERGPVIA